MKKKCIVCPQDRAGVYLARVVIREVGPGILRGDSGQQEGPPLLANAVMVVGPVGWGGLQHHTASESGASPTC